jgi:hypothetical protein
MTNKIKSEYYFLIFTLFIGLFLILKMFTFPTDGVLHVTISQSKTGLSVLDTKRNISSTKIIRVDTINFLQGRMLEHPQIGKLGSSKNFFMDIKTQMDVIQKGTYQFDITSDDGFRMKLNNKIACEHPGNRPMQTTTCQVPLEKGVYQFNLSYFQGGGPMGLKAFYQSRGGTRHLIGADSKEISFKAVKK